MTLEVGKQHRELRVFGELDIALEKLAREEIGTSQFHVHHQKGDFRRYITVAELGAEFNAVEDLDPLWSKADMFTMQIPVAVTDAPFPDSPP